MRGIGTVIAALLVLCAFAGCGGDDGDAPPPDSGAGQPTQGAPEAKALWGEDFMGVAVTAEPGAKEPPIKRAKEIALGFGNERDQSLHWSGLCNQNRAQVEITATQLAVSAAGGTLMGCFDGREKEDAWVFKFLEAEPEWSLEGDTLTLSTDSAVFELERTSR